MAEKPDVGKAVGYQFKPSKVSYNKRDLILYSIGIGVDDLKFLYELDANFSAFPTYPLVLALKGSDQDVNLFGKRGFEAIPGVPKYDLAMLVHGEQYLEVLRPLPLKGDFEMRGKVVGVYDKGSGMVIEQESLLVDEKGNAYCRMIGSSFIRGYGNFGGPRGPKVDSLKPPSRPADATVELKTGQNQALLYRLSGDYNPLHADPQLAKRLKFPAPILHGLCSYGIAAQSILKTFGENDPNRFVSIRARFSAPVIPGETLETQMWKVESEKKGHVNVIFVTKAKERNVVVISDGLVVLKTDANQLPKASL